MGSLFVLHGHRRAGCLVRCGRLCTCSWAYLHGWFGEYAALQEPRVRCLSLYSSWPPTPYGLGYFLSGARVAWLSSRYSCFGSLSLQLLVCSGGSAGCRQRCSFHIWRGYLLHQRSHCLYGNLTPGFSGDPQQNSLNQTDHKHSHTSTVRLPQTLNDCFPERAMVCIVPIKRKLSTALCLTGSPLNIVKSW